MAILITGCSTGIGFYLATQFHQSGKEVIASCRKEKDVLRLQKMGLKAICLDLNEESAISQGFQQACELANHSIDVLINNAGFAQAGALEDLSLAAMQKQFMTNVLGLQLLSNLAIKQMRAQGYGRIINISSILGIVSLPFTGIYNASKYALEGMTDSLRLELYHSPIKAVLIEPGPIESQFRDNVVDNSLKEIDINASYFKKNYQLMLTSYKAKKRDSIFTSSPHSVYKKVKQAIQAKNPKPRYLVTFPAYLLYFLKKLLPTKVMDYILRRIAKEELLPSYIE